MVALDWLAWRCCTWCCLLVNDGGDLPVEDHKAELSMSSLGRPTLAVRWVACTLLQASSTLHRPVPGHHRVVLQLLPVGLHGQLEGAEAAVRGGGPRGAAAGGRMSGVGMLEDRQN